jgi:hypothetical protein
MSRKLIPIGRGRQAWRASNCDAKRPCVFVLKLFWRKGKENQQRKSFALSGQWVA